VDLVVARCWRRQDQYDSQQKEEST
jgi:hypothetical protein